MANVYFKSGLSSKFATITDSLNFNTFYFLTDTNELYFGTSKITNAADLAALTTRVGTAEELLTKLDGADSVTGSIKQQIKAAIEALDGSATIASVNNHVVTIKAGITETDGVISNNSDADITLAAIAHSGAASDVSVDTSDAGTTGATVQAAIKELKSAISNLTTDSAVTLEEDVTPTTSMFKTYSFYQGDISDSTKKAAALIGKIDIPKDFLVKSGKVVTISSNLDSDSEATSGLADGTYLKLVLNSKDDAETASKIYINVATLVDTYTAAQNADEVQLTVSGYTLSASIVDVDAGKVTYIAADSTANPAVARESVKAALQRLDGSDSTSGSVSKKIKDAIEALDATVSIEDTQSTNPLNISITQADGVITGVTGSIDANTFDTYGSAAAVLGDSTNDTASTKTVEGLVKKTDATNTLIGSIPVKGGAGADAEDPVASTVIGYVNYKTNAVVSDLDSSASIASKSGNRITLKAGLVETDGVVTNNSDSDIQLADIASTGAAVNASIADANSIYTASNVEDALQEVKQLANVNAALLTWQEF